MLKVTYNGQLILGLIPEHTDLCSKDIFIVSTLSRPGNEPFIEFFLPIFIAYDKLTWK